MKASALLGFEQATKYGVFVDRQGNKERFMAVTFKLYFQEHSVSHPRLWSAVGLQNHHMVASCVGYRCLALTYACRLKRGTDRAKCLLTCVRVSLR